MATERRGKAAETGLNLRKFGFEFTKGRINPEGPETVFRELREAVLAHGFAILRDQRFTDAELKAFAARFGTIDDRVIKYSTVGPVESKDATRWHHHSNCDGGLDDWIVYYTPAVPDGGGTIEFFDAAGWLHLASPADREWARTRKVRHDYTSVAHAGIPPIANPPWHPMITRRETADGIQEAFYLGDHAVEIEGIDDLEMRSLATPYGRIRDLARRPDLYYVHEARPHDLIIWDLRMLSHRSQPWTTRTLRVIHEVIIRKVV